MFVAQGKFEYSLIGLKFKHHHCPPPIFFPWLLNTLEFLLVPLRELISELLFLLPSFFLIRKLENEEDVVKQLPFLQTRGRKVFYRVCLNVSLLQRIPREKSENGKKNLVRIFDASSLLWGYVKKYSEEQIRRKKRCASLYAVQSVELT